MTNAFLTILFTQSYLPGALVLAHALRESKTKHKIAVLVDPELSSESVEKLRVSNQDLPVHS